MSRPPTREECQAYARRWKEPAFDQAFRIALRDLPPRPTSGLVEWQRWMAVWRQRG